MTEKQKVLVTGGGGYVGSKLVPQLLAQGYAVRVFDLFFFGIEVLDAVRDHPDLEVVRGDIREEELLPLIVKGCDTVIHLACISNDPSFEMDPDLGKSINYTAFVPLVQAAKEGGVRRFIYASSSSVYGIKQERNVTEDLDLEPLTDYSKYKALCEDLLLERRSSGFECVVIRPATVCGFSSRLRLDVVVNLLTAQAYCNRRMTLFGGSQLRPNIHIQDMVDAYCCLLEQPAAKVDGEIFNAGYQNLTIEEIGGLICNVIGKDVEVVVTPTDDNRSYHISSAKMEKQLGFHPKHTVEMAVQELVEAFKDGRVKDPLTNPVYYNIRQLQGLVMA